MDKRSSSLLQPYKVISHYIVILKYNEFELSYLKAQHVRSIGNKANCKKFNTYMLLVFTGLFDDEGLHHSQFHIFYKL